MFRTSLWHSSFLHTEHSYVHVAGPESDIDLSATYSLIKLNSGSKSDSL